MMTPREGDAPLPYAGETAGMRTRDLAGSVAIDSELNGGAFIEAATGLAPGQQPNEDIFTYLLECSSPTSRLTAAASFTVI
jgi:hypothetical protein